MKLGMMPLWTKDGRKHVVTLLQVRNRRCNKSVCVLRSICANLNGQYLYPETFDCGEEEVKSSIDTVKELYF